MSASSPSTTTTRAVIFDMDGLLIDTERPAKVAWQRGADMIGEELTDETMDSLIGCHVNACLDQLGELWGRDLRKEEFLERVDDIYFSHFMRHGIDVMPGVVEVLEALRERNIPCCVATSSELEIAPRKLRLAKLEDYFVHISSGCEVAEAKPAPDVFLLALERLGLTASDCLVLEDSYNGIRAASAAGIPSMMIPDQLPPTPEMEQLTDGIYASLTEARSAILNRLV